MTSLFVSWATPHKGKPLSRQRLSLWILEAVSLAYGCKGLQPPQGLRAHSTRGMATSWALFRGVSVQDICAAASWATPHTFVRFYRLDVSRAICSTGGAGGEQTRICIALPGFKLFRASGDLCNPGVVYISHSETPNEVRKIT